MSLINNFFPDGGDAGADADADARSNGATVSPNAAAATAAAAVAAVTDEKEIIKDATEIIKGKFDAKKELINQ